MTAAFLQSELISLIADSKKRSTDVRAAAERSLSDLRSITVTSEVQLAADLSRRLHFIDPFVLACQSRNAKLANSAATCMQRLVASRAVAKERLEDVLNGFKDVVNTSYEVQLKILQTLPAILQLYPSEVRGSLLARTLEICAILEASKTSLVSSSARATFEQLVESVFERARLDVDRSATHARIASTDSLSTLADDASRIFEDLCSILNGSESTFLHVENSSPLFILETIEKILDGNSTYIKAKPYLVEACRTQLLPALIALLDAKDDLHMIAQILRTCFVILQKLPSQLLYDMRDILSTFLTFLDRDSGSTWKRVLGLEFFQQICANFVLVMRVFDSFNGEATNVIVTLMATLVRVAAEDPTLIGLGRQSTVPVHSGGDAREAEMASIEAQGIGGGLASVDSADASVTGISLDFSTLEKRLMDDEDYSSTRAIPKTYIYALALESISSFCEGLSKFIMPLSVSSRHAETVDTGTEDDGEEEIPAVEATKSQTRARAGHKYQRLANPLKMSSLPQLPQVKACSEMIDQCWPAVLATCSTFLNAALDSHFYHVLIRSMQKLAQVSGTLELGTPRDALLTSLAKGSVPPNAAAIITQSQASREEEKDASYTNGVRSATLEAPLSPTQPRQSLNVRHLLCLRALLNLGIALGPTLAQESWFIIVETLQQVEALMSIAGMSTGISTLAVPKMEVDSETQTSLAGEMTAVNAASKRMFESTRSYSDGSFAAVAQALLWMTGDLQGPGGPPRVEEIVQSPATLMSPTTFNRTHHTSRSVSGLWIKTKALDTEVSFVLARTQELARVNLHRFALASSNACTWDLIVPRLLRVSKTSDIKRDLRLKSASIVDLIAMEVIKMLDTEMLTIEEINHLQCKCLEVLVAQIVPDDLVTDPASQEQGIQEELRRRAFEALENILGHSGESFRQAWELVFQILSCGISSGRFSGDRIDSIGVTPIAFRCIELICNDFLQILGPESLARLIRLLFLFGAQANDLNMSLTTASLLRNICSLLQSQQETVNVTREDFQSQSPIVSPDSDSATQLTHLWAMALHQLNRMCSDRRTEVRDASMRILMQVLESAGDQLSISSWGIALDECVFSTLAKYQSLVSGDPESTYLLSLAKVVEGLTLLMAHNISYLIADASFDNMWSRLLEVFATIVEKTTSMVRRLLFESLTKLLELLHEVSQDSARYVAPVLRLWAESNPFEADDEELVPNQSLLAAHVRLFVQAQSASPDAAASFSFGNKNAAEYAMQSVRQALLSARHPPYTSDIRKRTVEQDAAFDTITILRSLLNAAPDQYISFLLELIQSMLPKEREDLSSQGLAVSKTNQIQKPSYIAMLSSCIDLLRQSVEESHALEKAWKVPQLHRSLNLMSDLISTKYTNIPTNPDAPLWRNATATAVCIMEASRTFSPSLQNMIDLSENDVLITSVESCISSILSQGGLDTPSSLPTPSTIFSDEEFDTIHFQRFHNAVLPALSSRSTAQQQKIQYILTLFNASFVSKPWLGDFPNAAELLANPLGSLALMRDSSVHHLFFPKRSRIPYAALDVLFKLLTPAPDSSQDSGTPEPIYARDIAIEAVPYVLLRTVHPMKTFLADQPLRGLTPLPAKMQEELKWILERCVDMRVDDVAFRDGVAMALVKNNPDTKQHGGEGESGCGGSAGDGKSHLRFLFSFLLKFQRGWRGMMRIPDRRGWQDGEVGRAVEAAMEKWIDAVGEGWGMK